MPGEAKRPQRHMSHDGAHAQFDYNFSIEIVLKQPSLDERRVRKLIEDDIRRLTAAVNNVR